MIPERLPATGFSSLVFQWRDMWNNHLREHLFQSRLIAGPGIRLAQTPAGTSISAVVRPAGGQRMPEGGAGAEYDGEFKLVKATPEGASSPVVRLIDGSDPASQYAGEADLGRVPVLSADFAAGKYYFLKATYSSSSGSYSFALEARNTGEEQSITQLASGTVRWYIGRTDSNGALIQEHVSGRIYFSTRWFV